MRRAEVVVNQNTVVHADAEEDGGKSDADDIEAAEKDTGRNESGQQGEQLEEHDPSERTQRAVENPEGGRQQEDRGDHHKDDVAPHLAGDVGVENRATGEQNFSGGVSRDGATQGGDEGVIGGTVRER